MNPFYILRLAIFLTYAISMGTGLIITTNGTLIEETGEAIVFKPALRQVNFSLHSFDANKNEYTMDSYLDRIFNFISKSREKNVLQICLRLWNISEAGKNENNKYVLQRLEKEFGLGFTIQDKLTPCNGINLAENVFLNQAARFDWPDTELEDIDCKGFCYGLRRAVYNSG